MKIIYIFSLLAYLYTSSLLHIQFQSADVNRVIFKKPWLLYIPMVLPFLLAYIVSIPLPFFYLMIYITVCIPPLIIHGGKIKEWLFINVRFLLFTVLHLIVLGCLAFMAEQSVQYILSDSGLRTASFMIVFWLDSIVNLLIHHYIETELLRFIEQDSEILRLFSGFAWFGSFFTLMDSIPCLFELPAKLAVLFLIGSNILLLMLLILFANRAFVIASNAYLKIENLRLKEEEIQQRHRTLKLEHEAYIDVLTGAYTRRYAVNNMISMMELKEHFILVFIDLDRLKQVNDLQGHEAGDLYLQKFSAMMKESLRPNDIFVRHGGDEFLILLPGCTAAGAEEMISRIREKAGAAGPDGWGIPFSYGLADVSTEDGLSPEEWIAAADRLMYEDKKRQRGILEESVR